MKNEFINKMLTKHSKECHTSAMAYINMVTNAAMAQMKIERCTISEDITPQLIGHYAARNLGIDAEHLTQEITSMMVLEGLVEIVREIHYPEGS